MFEYIATCVIGAIVILLGITNMMGNISTLHSYHRKNVSEADRPAFGRLMGLGTVILGSGVVIFGVLMAVGAENPIITICATTIMIIGIIVGLGISFYAMKKYNGGIF